MLRKLRERMYTEEKGFTLIELLVVMLIIGILAAIALPAFLGQRSKGQDSAAKSDARNMVTHVESCYANEEDYTKCTSPADTGLPTTVTVASTAANTYKVTATSKSGNKFYIERTSGGEMKRTCDTASKGGCASDGTW